MPIPFFFVGVVLAVVGAAVSWYDRRRESPAGPAVPPDVIRAVVAVRAQRATPAQMRVAAVGAQASGHAGLGRALLAQAAYVENIDRLTVDPAVRDVTYPSPLDGVDDASWNTYVRRARLARVGTHSEWNRFGAYQLNPRMLADIGLMVNARKGEYRGHASLWLGDWAPGQSAEAFLASDVAQVEALADLVRLHARVIRVRHQGAIGTEIEGVPVSLSGLLAVAQRAGLGGLSKWIADAEDRAGFPETTAAYKRLNGIF